MGNATVTGLLEAIQGVLPAINDSHAAVVLAATLRQLTAGIDFEQLIVDEASAPKTISLAVDEWEGLD